jgi:hypothetical protein
LSSFIDPPKRDRWARLRFSIIGPLLAAPPAVGELQAALSTLAVKRWRHPLSGLEVCFGQVDAGALVLPARTLPTRSPVSETGCAATSAVSPASCPRTVEGLTASTASIPAGPRNCTSTTCASPWAATRRCRPTPRFDATSRRRACSAKLVQARHRRRVTGPRPPRPAGGQELRGRSCVGTLAPRFPSRQTQGADTCRDLGQAPAARGDRRPLAARLPLAVVSRRNGREPHTRTVASLHEARDCHAP